MTSDEPEQPGAPPTGAPATEPPPPAQTPRRLTRSRHNRMIAGVAGGLANYLAIDATWVRVAFVVAAVLTHGAFILLYFAAIVIVPREDDGAPAAWTARGPSSSKIGAIVLGLVLILAGAFALLYTLDIPAPPWSAVLSAALVLVGLGIIVDGRRGVNAGLVFIALILTALLAFGSGPSVKFDSAFGDRTVHPTTASQLESEYSHAFGKMTLDLRDVDFPAGDTNIAVSMSFGDLDLALPTGIPVQVSGSTSFGHSNILGQDFDGRMSHEYRSADYAGAPRRLNIDLTTSFGSARVHR